MIHWYGMHPVLLGAQAKKLEIDFFLKLPQVPRLRVEKDKVIKKLF